MKSTHILLEYIDRNYDRLVEAYGKAVIDAVKADFKKQIADNPGVQGFMDPVTKKPFTDDQLDQFINAFYDMKGNLPAPKNDIYNYTTSKNQFEFDDFFSTLATKGKIKKKDDPTLNIPDLIYSNEDGTIKLFNGNREDLCTRFSSEVPWCITKGSWAGYRYNANNGYPTFYLVRNANLPDNDKLSFVAIQSRANDKWVYTNRKNSPYESRVMDFSTLLSEIPWLSQIPDVKSKMPWVDVTDDEKAEREWRFNPIDYSTWELYLTPDQKLRYLTIRKESGGLFDDLSEEAFIIQKFPKLDKNLKENLIRNQIIDADLLIRNYKSFTENDQKLILRFYLQEGRLTVKQAEKIFKNSNVPFELKKDIIENNRVAKEDRSRFFIKGENIVELIFNGNFSDMSITVFEKKGDSTIEKKYTDIPKSVGTKYLNDYPEIDTLPFKVLLKLASNDVVSQDTIRTVINKAKESTDSAMIVKDLEDGSSLLIDTNAFEAYKVEGSRLTTVPFTSPEVQTALTGESDNSKVINNILSPFIISDEIPNNISKSTILSLVKNIPASNRIIQAVRGGLSIVVPAENESDEIVFRVIPLNKEATTPVAYGLRTNWRSAGFDYGSTRTQEYWKTKFDYFRANNITYDNPDVRSVFASGRQIIEPFLAENPPLNPDNTLKIITYQGAYYLFNTANPRESFRLGTSDRMLAKSFNARDIAAITGQQAPAAARAPRAAAAQAEPAAAAPAGEANAGVTELITNAGLTTGFNALPTAFRNRILDGTVTNVNANRTARSRQASLGNRGRVIGAVSAGQDQMVIIRMGDNTFAQASFQPDARHYIITPTRALNMGRVGNFIDFISNNANLTESQKEALTRVALGAATKEELAEIKAKYQKKPYKDLEVTNEYIIREFDENIDPIELKWHRDNEDRIVEIVGNTDWKVQLENQLPISINQPISIPRGEWHRVIKGTGKLTLKIIKEESTQYTFAGVLITNTSSEDGRPQKDILSDIRAIEGITIVTSKDYDTSGESSAFNNPNYYSIIKVKVDPNPYKTGFTSEDLQNMLKEIRGIKGVKNFKLNQAVEKTTV